MEGQMGVEDADSHKLGLHPHQVSQWLDGRIMPMHAEIGLTNKCNHHCSFCTLDWITHGKETLDSATLGRLMQDLKYMGTKSVYFAGEGEPTLHPEFVDIVNGTAHMGMKVAVATNGQRYDHIMADTTLKNISWIRFSLDTVDPVLHEKIHGVKTLGQILVNIKAAVLIKKERGLEVDIGVQVVLTEETALTLNQTVEAMRDICVDNVQIKPCHIHPGSSHKEPMNVGMYDHVQVEMKDYESDGFKVVVRTRSMNRLEESRSYDRCNGFDFYALIAANGDVVPCNVFYRNEGFIFGNIFKDSIRDIWSGVRRREIIKIIENSCFSHCGDYRCRLDIMNRYLHRVKNPEWNDVFI
jgi:radical SAM protein with 4Fe4S-binding SPASM domain